ncbi:hypothetical protein AB1Y20_007008 [Prymnesium parvum]|uniref:Uncharacterized protein n=1 Tax=Prymnesium parvum TaxID=97485 RepID=A0AB34J031_PRYPA
MPHVHAVRAQDLQSLGDQSTASLLFTSILARSATELLLLYAPLRPSAARAPQLHRDLRFLLSFFRAHLPPPRPPPPAAARAEAQAHAAVRALLSLLALHAAPLGALLPPLRAAAAAAAAGAAAWGEAALEAVGGGGGAEEACAALALPPMAPPAGGGGAYDPLQQHLRLQAAAEAAWPADVAWGALLREENFPLARLPRLVLAAVANRPDVAAEAEPAAATDGDAVEVRRLLAAVAERREGGAQLSGERAAEL